MQLFDFVTLDPPTAAHAAVTQAADILKSVLALKGNREVKQHFVPGGGDG